MSDRVWCKFQHVPSKQDGDQLAANIETFVRPKSFDKSGLKNCGAGGNDSMDFTLSRTEADRLRDALPQVLPDQNSPIWFSMQSEPFHLLMSRAVETNNVTRHHGSKFTAVCQFGSLRSYSEFYTHAPLDNKIVSVYLRPERPEPNTLTLEFDTTRIIIPIESIQRKNILVNKEHKNGIHVLLPLKYAPRIYRLEPMRNADKSDGNSDMKQHRVCRHGQNPDFIKTITHCSDLLLHFKPSETTAWVFLSYFLMQKTIRFEINFSTFKVSAAPDDARGSEACDPFNDKDPSFQSRYALQMLDSLGYVFRDKVKELVDQQQLNWKTWKVEDRYPLCCFAVEQLLKDHGYDLRRTEKDYIETRKKAEKVVHETNEETVSVPKRERIPVAACTLTPLKLIVQPFEISTGNRAMRIPEFGGVERFLLVHFREEDNKQLRVTGESTKKRLRNSMEDGINLLKRKFKYVGASTSQMKEMGFWFIDLPSSVPNMKAAHDLFGTFSGIKNIATYIARVGQYFSSTWSVGIKLVKIDIKDRKPSSGVYQVWEIPDIKTPDDRCFTDGIGTISWGLAGRIAQKMNMTLTRKEDIPSAYQVRVAGCKGMVAIDPKSTLNDYYMCVRKSMIKFPSGDWNLEICEYARPLTLTFNNQVIRLLSDLNNPDSTFVAFQNQALSHWQVPEEEQLTAIDIAVNKNAAYSLSKDNLLTNRIPVPPTQGRNLFGVADETGQLKYGQCFIQYSSLNSSDSEQRKYHVVTGDVIVTKNPCLWPGDFRRLTAVANKNLQECMRDVIVFPITGKRPHSNEISGSDLDGDQYWVYWGDRLHIDEMVEPLSYTAAEKKEVPSFDTPQIINHIVESFGAGVVLGMIANTHTAVADKHEQHSHSEPCKKLAELFALAVDSPKTGKFIDKHELRPFQKEYCRSWPKFMRKPAEPVHDSNSVLEKLYMNAEEKYCASRELPVIGQPPQRKRSKKVASTDPAVDPNFQSWLTGGVYPKMKTTEVGASKQSDDDDEDSPSPVAPARSTKSAKNPVTTEKNTQKEKTADRPETPVTSSIEPKKPLKKAAKSTATLDENTKEKPGRKSTTQSDSPKNAMEKVELINSGATALPSLSFSSLSALNNDPFSPSFHLAVDMRVTSKSDVQFSPVGGGLYTVNLKKEAEAAPDRDQIIDKLVKNLSSETVFKKKTTTYQEAVHGSLHLIIFYGHIQFVEQNPFPQKYEGLIELIKEKHDQLIHFEYAKSDQLNVGNGASSTTKKNKIEYEFDCYLSSSPLTYITLLFDNSKTLQQVRVYSKWLKYYVRQPNFIADCLYEIRSVLTHDSGSSQFNSVRDSVFKTDRTDLLSNRKPNIKINREILQKSVVPISLKVIDDDQATHISQASVDAFYRKVKDVSINEQQEEKIKVISTIEYHVSPISKDDTLLNQVCDIALSATEAASRSSGARGSLNFQQIGLRHTGPFKLFENH